MRNIDFLRNKPIAHRGLHNKELNIPENSISAFKEAIAKGLPIELDVHLLKDGKLVVFHDDNLNRMTGLNKKIKDCNYDEIKDLWLDKTVHRIPLFKEVLELVHGRVPILIEIKTDRKPGETEKVLAENLKGYKGEYAVQSFSPLSVRWFRKNLPSVPRGQLSCNFNKDNMCIIKKFLLKNLWFNFCTDPDFISYCVDNVPNKRLEKFRKKGKLVIGWTVKNKENLKKVKDYFDNFIFENLDITDFE